TPRWQSRLPGWRYRGPDPDGFMTKSEVVAYLDEYARSFRAPLHTGVAVTRVHGRGDSFEVQTDSGSWESSNVVIATGHCARAAVPAFAAELARDIDQLVPTQYRNPRQLRGGGVLVVGASATGIQLASEIARTGREVILAVGNHIRMPRSYRGRDIMAWLDEMGVLAETASQVPDIEASRRQPSLQLIGTEEGGSLDLQVLQEHGVRIMGRMTGVSGHQAYFSNNLADSIGHAERKMHEMLDRIDSHISRLRLTNAFPVEPRPPAVAVPMAPRAVNLRDRGVDTVLWATGYRREYPWLQIPVLDQKGEIIHRGGVTARPGLYVLGLQFMRRRNSAFLDGVGADAADLTDHIVQRGAGHLVAAA
ncbi:MAG TPA: NAD(P)-binding domain-containing protein, partial [Candidatus Baltobacteraceae bacterium]|nr:NAD(P)-binding domain-containing protein [Candidatus Baltobacteraceae bacterium]